MENIIAPLPLPNNQENPNAKLSFILNDDGTWNKIVITMDGLILLETKNITLSDENKNKEYFDDWENQIRGFLNCNIIEVERFI